MRSARIVVFAILACAFSGSIAASDLDPTWDSPGGYTVTPIARYDIANPGTAEADPHALAIDSLGRAVIAGFSYPYYQQDPRFTAVRYIGDNDPNSTGLEDPGFKNGTQDGVAVVAVGFGPAYGYAVQIGAGDGVVIAGVCEDFVIHTWAFCLARFNSNGAVDGSFGNQFNGTTITNVGTAEAYARAMTTDSTGSFLVAGTSYSTGTGVMTVARYNGSGFQDAGFGSGGFALIADPTAQASAQGYAIAVDGDGKILVAGTTESPSYTSGRFAVTRLLASGLPDATFNGGNLLTIDMGGMVDQGVSSNFLPNFAITADSSNRPIIVGSVYPSGASVIGIARLTSAGALDATFGTGGKVTTALTGCTNAVPSGVQVDASGNLFVSAQCTTATQDGVALVHYTPKGHLDTAYGPSGYQVSDNFGTSAGGVAVALDAQGRPIVAAIDYRSVGMDSIPAFLIFRHDYVSSNGFD